MRYEASAYASKQCIRCGLVKPIGEFYEQAGRTNKQSFCKSCDKARHRIRSTFKHPSCLQCGSPFTGTAKAKFCSTACNCRFQAALRASRIPLQDAAPREPGGPS